MSSNSIAHPVSTGLSRERIQRFASGIAMRLVPDASDRIDSEQGPIIDPRDVLRRCRGELRTKDFRAEGRDRAGSLEVFSDGTFVVYVPVGCDPEVENFTIGHELGHYFAHFLPKHGANQSSDEDQRLVFSASRYGGDSTEFEANWFSWAFLMPDEVFTKAVDQKMTDVELSQRFGVSIADVRYRREQLRRSDV